MSEAVVVDLNSEISEQFVDHNLQVTVVKLQFLYRIS